MLKYLALAGLFAMPAHASQCGPRDAVLKHLQERFAETRRGIGIAANDTVMELFAAETVTWTITVTLPDGNTCLVASGVGYEPITEALPAPGIDG